jgi:ribosome-binding ATPase YchF (GTP1/OBG family)
VEKKAKAGDAESVKLLEIYKKLEKQLNEGKPAVRSWLPPEERELVKDLFLHTNKPVLYVANVAEGEIHKTSPLWRP